MLDRVVRLGQTLKPFGVGAIYDVLGESFVASDISAWQRPMARLLRSPRLSHALGVRELREAPSRNESPNARTAVGIPFARFPRWLFCSSCRRMVHWLPRFEVPTEPARCTACGSRKPLVPMRFIVACAAGHLDDVPWHIWAHSGSDDPEQKQCQREDLRFLTDPRAGGGLASLVVKCETCRASRSLAGITGPRSMASLHIRCRGIQPWQVPTPELAHDDPAPEVLQRGASNVYFASVASALDIPPESRFDARQELVNEILATSEFDVIAGAPEGPIAGMLIHVLAMRFGVTPADIEALVRSEVEQRSGVIVTGDQEDDLLGAEWLAFVTPHVESGDRDSFITRHVDLSGLAAAPGAPSPVLGHLAHVVKAVRLREVRALVGFSRIRPGNQLVKPDLGRKLGFLPALEVFGEGVFLALDEATVCAWERGPAADRAAVLATRRSSSIQRDWLPAASPRFIMLHTLAHLLIRQMAFESGYSAASLTERIYCREPTGEGPGYAGLLIYTAAGDQEGTLGGLVRQGEANRLATTMLALLERAAWCSADPICRESSGQGVAALNLAACHACALVAETSCGHSNALLDRGLVVGSPEVGVSFFGRVFEAAIEQAARAG